jgi:hypothetical protein
MPSERRQTKWRILNADVDLIWSSPAFGGPRLVAIDPVIQSDERARSKSTAPPRPLS